MPGPSNHDPEVAETVASPDQREHQVQPYFELFVFETLTLPRGLFAEDEHGEVQFF